MNEVELTWRRPEEETEIKDMRKIMEMVFEQVEAAVVMAHIQKEELHNLLEEDRKLGGQRFPPELLKKLQGEIVQELASINNGLRRVGNMVLGESGKS